MAGLIIIQSKCRDLSDDARCDSTLAWSARFGSTAQFSSRRVFAAIWRRHQGEFANSGTLSTGSDGTHALWIGQILPELGSSPADVIDPIRVHAMTPARLSHINGAFIAAGIASDGRTVRICNDRFGHYPLFQYEDDEIVAISTSVEAVLPWMRRRELDHHSVELFMRAGELLDDATLLRGVRFVPGGTILTLSDGVIASERYWRMRLEPDATVSMVDAAEECGRLLRRAVTRACAANSSVGVPLSGGLDSRFLLGLCPDPTSVPSFTMGLPGCRDLRFAREFAERIGSPHAAFHWQPELFPPLWSEGVAATAGCFGVGDMFMLPYAQIFAQHCDVTLNGLAGDALLGGNFVKLKWLRSRSLNEIGRSTWSWRVTEPTDLTVDRLLTHVTGREAAISRWTSSISGACSDSPALKLVEWLCCNRVFRFTNCGTSLLRRHVESHSPFFDNDVIDFLSKVPLAYRYKHRLYIECLCRACPVAASVAWQRTHIAPSRGFAASCIAMVGHKLAGAVDRFFGSDLLGDMKVADPAAWLRSGPWAEPAKVVLLNEQCLDRGLFRPEAVRTILGAHQAGRDESRIISRLLAVELFSRQICGALPGPSQASHTVAI